MRSNRLWATRFLVASLLIIGVGSALSGCGAHNSTTAQTTTTSASSASTQTSPPTTAAPARNDVLHYAGAVQRDVAADPSETSCEQTSTGKGGAFSVSVIDPLYDSTPSVKTVGFTVSVLSTSTKQVPYIPTGSLSSQSLPAGTTADVKVNPGGNAQYDAGAGYEGSAPTGHFDITIGSGGLSGTVTAEVPGTGDDGVQGTITVHGSWRCSKVEKQF